MVSLFYLFFGLIVLSVEIHAVIKYRIIQINNITGVAFAVFLFLLPACIFAFGKDMEILYRRLPNGDLVILLMSLICYATYKIGYRTTSTNVVQNRGRICKSPLIYATILTVVSIICFYYWAMNYGSIEMLLLQANGIRAGFVEAENNSAFFKHFVPLSQFVSLYLFNQYLLLKNYKQISHTKGALAFVLFLITVFISILYLLANDGRGPLGFYLIYFALAYLVHQLKSQNKGVFAKIFKGSLIACAILFLILNGDYVLQTLRGESISMSDVDSTSNEGIVASLCNNFKFIVISHYYSLYYTIENFGSFIIFDDIISGLTAWLPTSLKPFDVTNTWDFNTNIAKTFVGEFHGQTPHSILSNSLYDLGVFGIFILPYLYGKINKKIDNYFYNRTDDAFYYTIYIFLFIKVGLIVQGCSLYYIALEMFFLFLAWVLYLVFSKKNKNEENFMSL